MATGDEKNWTNPSRLLYRQIGELEGASPLIVAPPDDGFASFFAADAGRGVTVQNFDFRSQAYQTKIFAETGLDPTQVMFGEWYEPKVTHHDSAIVYLPKGRDLIEYVLRMVSQSVATGGFVYLVGENNAGIRSARDVFSEIAGDIVWSDAARHCVIYAARNRSLESAVSSFDFLQTDEFVVDDEVLTIKTLPGVFSRGRIDAGTGLLLESLPELKGRALDFGCGCGIVGAVIKRRSPAVSVELLDNSALAVRSARLTLQANSINDANVCASDGFSEVKGRFDTIISNPPFHRGVGTDYEVVEKLIFEAKSFLEPGGKLMIVANRFLRYRPLLESRFGSCSILAENSAYRVYQAF